jgi:uncharacterized phage-associated protein
MWSEILPDVWDTFFRPSGAWSFVSARHPRLAPWAAFFRRFAAAELSNSRYCLKKLFHPEELRKRLFAVPRDR